MTHTLTQFLPWWVPYRRALQTGFTFPISASGTVFGSSTFTGYTRTKRLAPLSPGGEQKHCAGHRADHLQPDAQRRPRAVHHRRQRGALHICIYIYIHILLYYVCIYHIIIYTSLSLSLSLCLSLSLYIYIYIYI